MLRLAQVPLLGWNLGLVLISLASMPVPRLRCHTDLLCHFLLDDLEQGAETSLQTGDSINTWLLRLLGGLKVLTYIYIKHLAVSGT